MLIQCRTVFDITQTKITGHFKPSQVPFTDQADQTITDIHAWNKSRNQQRNWETISQLLQLRTQIFDTSTPVNNNGYWIFDFVIESNGVYQLDNDEFGILKQDSEGVPMIIGLNEQYSLTPMLITQGSQQNIWFELLSVNN